MNKLQYFEGIKPVTHILGLVGEAISASFTPPMHEMFGRAMGMSVAYQPIDLAVLDIGPEDLADILTWARRLGFTGLNITAPCKQTVIPLLDELSERAETLQAVNTVTFRDGRAIGYNTDWCGFLFSFRRNLPDAKADHLVLMGAGGAGTAVAYGMLDAGAKTITIFDTIPEREQALVDRMTDIYGPGRAMSGTDLEAAMAGADGAVNATTRGMTGHEPGSSIPAELLRPGMWVADCVYLPTETQLLRDAIAAKCRVLPGTGMAVEQAVEAFRIFTGVEIDPEVAYGVFGQLMAVHSR